MTEDGCLDHTREGQDGDKSWMLEQNRGKERWRHGKKTFRHRCLWVGYKGQLSIPTDFLSLSGSTLLGHLSQLTDSTSPHPLSGSSIWVSGLF